MKRYFIFFILCLKHVLEALSVTSDYAEYSGSTCTLQGNVVVRHALGTLFSDRVELLSKSQNGKAAFDQGLFEGNVKVEFANGNILWCQKAELDNTLGWLEAYQDVHFSHEDLLFHADIATYQTDLKKFSQELTGHIFLKKIESNGKCRVTQANDKEIDAESIDIDISKKQIAFTDAQGAIQLKNPNTAHLLFSGKKILWDELSGILSIAEDASLQLDNLASVQANKTLKMQLQATEEKKELQWIETEGQTKIVFNDKEQKKHTLLTPYNLLIDPKAKKISSASTSNEQILFQDSSGEIYTNAFTIFYKDLNHRFELTNLLLEGNVKIFNREAFDAETSKANIEYALADRVDYFPETKEMSLSSFGKNRVLLFDRINNLEVSATSLKIKRDETTKRESIQGTGDVRFSFIKQEIDELKKQFQRV